MSVKDAESKAALALRAEPDIEGGHDWNQLRRLDAAFRSGHITASELKQELEEIRRVERDSGRTPEVAE